MNALLDVAGYDRWGNLVVVAEVKARTSGGDDWAEQFRRNLLVHGTLPDAPYFLIVTQDTVHLWIRGVDEHYDAVSIPTNELFPPFASPNGFDVSRMHEEGLALATAGWLWNLTRRSPDDERFLEIGKALHDGTVRTDAAA